MFQEFEVMTISRQMKKMFELECEELMNTSGLRKVELDILYFISHAGDKDTAKDIISEHHISKAHISKSVDNLKQRGYICLTEDEEDHRCMHIQITSSGQPVINEFEYIHRHMMRKLFDGVTEQEWQYMRIVMNKILANIDIEL